MIELTQQGDIAILKLVHGKANALDLELCEAIAAKFKEIETSSARAVVMTGQGHIFSAGVDLLRLTAGGTDYVRNFLLALHKLYDTVFHHPKPVIAAVNGHAIAGGCVLQCCADKRIAAKEVGRIGVTELLVGVPFPAMAFEVMRFSTSPQYFPDIILSGTTFSTGEALARGLVDEVVEPDVVMARAFVVAQALSNLPPATFAMTKGQIRQPLVDRMAKDGARVDALAAQIWTSADTLEHVGAYVAKTLKKG
ncbi:MAG: enoyl-CoA hydratase/isomerase family protein [Pseudomonadota bacterium]